MQRKITNFEQHDVRGVLFSNRYDSSPIFLDLRNFKDLILDLKLVQVPSRRYLANL